MCTASVPPVSSGQRASPLAQLICSEAGTPVPMFLGCWVPTTWVAPGPAPSNTKYLAAKSRCGRRWQLGAVAGGRSLGKAEVSERLCRVEELSLLRRRRQQ